MSLDQAGLGLLKGGIVRPPGAGSKYDLPFAQEQPDATVLRIIVLGKQALPTGQLKRADPALQGQRGQASLSRQGLQQIGTRVNGLGLRLFDPKGLQHRILVTVLRIGSQLNHRQIVWHRAAHPELNLFAGGYALIGMQARQVDSMMRRNILR